MIIKSVVTALPNHVMSCYLLPECGSKILVEPREKHKRYALEIMGHVMYK